MFLSLILKRVLGSGKGAHPPVVVSTLLICTVATPMILDLTYAVGGGAA